MLHVSQRHFIGLKFDIFSFSFLSGDMIVRGNIIVVAFLHWS